MVNKYYYIQRRGVTLKSSVLSTLLVQRWRGSSGNVFHIHIYFIDITKYNHSINEQKLEYDIKIMVMSSFNAFKLQHLLQRSIYAAHNHNQQL